MSEEQKSCLTRIKEACEKALAANTSEAYEEAMEIVDKEYMSCPEP